MYIFPLIQEQTHPLQCHEQIDRHIRFGFALVSFLNGKIIEVKCVHLVDSIPINQMVEKKIIEESISVSSRESSWG